MKIYTRTGDQGETSLFGGTRVRKDHLRVQIYGTLDELNSALGLAICSLGSKAKPIAKFRAELTVVQNELFTLGTELATPEDKPLPIEPLGKASIERLEKLIDSMEAKLKPLKQFILPGGSEPAARLHLARTICRRAERELTGLDAGGSGDAVAELRDEPLMYLNRLSDYLFVAARFANLLMKVKDIPWVSH